MNSRGFPAAKYQEWLAQGLITEVGQSPREAGMATPRTDLADALSVALTLAGIPHKREARVVPDRDWRHDVYFPAERVAVECEGGIHGRGRHVRPQGFTDDIEKYNASVLAGNLLIRVTGKMIANGRALKLIEQALAARRAKS